MKLGQFLRVQRDHIRSALRLRHHFANPWLVIMLRLGFIRAKYFPYTVTNRGQCYTVLARPSTHSEADFFVLREVLVEEVYRDILPVLSKKGMRIVDIGANVGCFTIWLSHVAKVDEAFCFEPEADSLRLLRFNLDKNDCGFAQPLGKAVGGRARTMKLALKEESPGGTSIYRTESNNARGGNLIEVIAFADWLAKMPGEFDLLKMDCEGAEWEILRQTPPAVLSRFRVVVAEVHEDPEGLTPVVQFGALITSLGFRTIRWDGRSAGIYVGVREVPAA